MVNYAGGKHTHGKAIHGIITVIERELGFENLPYFEPFAGMCGVARHFARTDSRNVILCDLNPNIVALLRELQSHGVTRLPKTCRRAEFERLKNDDSISAAKGFLGIGCSFNNS